MEFELIVLAETSKEVEWLKKLLLDIKMWVQSMPCNSLFYNIKSTMPKTYNNTFRVGLNHEMIIFYICIYQVY